MIWLFAFYWVVCGFAAVAAGPTAPLPVEAICFVLGGFIVPAKLIAKALLS